MTTILGLDASSTVVGWCILQDNRAILHGEIKLPASNIADRCEAAQRELILLLEATPVDAVALEAAIVFPGRLSAAIPQARVSGAILAMLSLREIAWVEITPSEAKYAATGKGGAKKDAMQAKAADYGVYGEHASDALGICLAAVSRVEVCEVVE